MKQKKIIGLIGGMSFESTAVYYNLINKMYQEKAGGISSARLVLSSLDMQEVADLQRDGNWDKLRFMLCTAADDLAFRADFLVICTNTMHKLAADISREAGMEVLDVRCVTAAEIHALGFKTVGLLGTRFTMEEPFYKGYLEKCGIKVLVPDEEEIELVDRVIYDELCKGIVKPVSEALIQCIIKRLTENGSEAIILGCTELPLLLKQAAVPLLDTTSLHAKAAVEKAING